VAAQGCSLALLSRIFSRPRYIAFPHPKLSATAKLARGPSPATITAQA
jgi:hypothetical protein